MFVGIPVRQAPKIRRTITLPPWIKERETASACQEIRQIRPRPGGKLPAGACRRLDPPGDQAQASARRRRSLRRPPARASAALGLWATSNILSSSPTLVILLCKPLRKVNVLFDRLGFYPMRVLSRLQCLQLHARARRPTPHGHDGRTTAHADLTDGLNAMSPMEGHALRARRLELGGKLALRRARPTEDPKAPRQVPFPVVLARHRSAADINGLGGMYLGHGGEARRPSSSLLRQWWTRASLLTPSHGLFAGVADLFDMAVIRATAAAEHVDPRKTVSDRRVMGAQFGGISRVEVGCRVELRVAPL